MADTEVVFEPGRQDIVITRVFDAPRDVVFKAYTDPELVPRWWGSRRFTTIVDEMDVRRGGSWRFITRNSEDDNEQYPLGGDPQTPEYAFRGVYHDVAAPARIVATFEFELGGPGYLQFCVDSFEEVDGKTTYRSVVLFQSVEDRDGWIPTDMDQAIHESMDRLAEVIKEQQ